MIKQIKTGVYLLFLGVVSAQSYDAKPQMNILENIETCTTIVSDRDRLFCFDEAVNTPIFITPNTSLPAPSSINYPEEWRDVHYMEQKRTAGSEGFWRTENSLEHYDTLHFTQPVEDLGIVVLSCINNISRVEVMLNKPLYQGAVPIAIEGKNKEERRWLLDDTGYILREGRGLPSIAIIRNLMGEMQFTLTLNERHYTLSLKDFDEQVKQLQTLCHWR